MGVELYEMRSDPETAENLLGPGARKERSEKKGALMRGGPGGSKGGASRASLHTKAVFIDQRLAVIGSMNLDLRSQLKNSEVGLVINSVPLTQQAIGVVDKTLAIAAYRLESTNGGLVWRAPKGARFGDETKEPGASARMRLAVKLISPFAPDAML
jgi:putative cardiolipin synthase